VSSIVLLAVGFNPADKRHYHEIFAALAAGLVVIVVLCFAFALMSSTRDEKHAWPRVWLSMFLGLTTFLTVGFTQGTLR
jgi:FtsH-binding integral membrane protein